MTVFGVHTGPQNTTVDELRSLWTRIEDLGFDWISIWDHFYSADFKGYTNLEAVSIHTALACHTSRVRVGSLVYCAGYRHPAVLAKAITTIDHLSGGRADIGLGAGWAFNEYEAYGIPFPGLGERFDRLTEQLEIITGLWRTLPGERFSYTGAHYAIADSPALPKPVQQPHPPVIVGGVGAKRTPALAARFASEFNVPFAVEEKVAAQFARVDEACRAIGRDPAELVRSVAHTIAVGRDDAQVRQRALTIGRDPADMKVNGLSGTVAEVVDRLGQWREKTGITRIYLQLLDLADLDQVELIAAEVAPQLG